MKSNSYPLTQQAIERLVERIDLLERLLRELRDVREQEADMLRCALHELAGALDVADRRRFARNWIVDKHRAWLLDRNLPRKGVGVDSK